MKITKEALIAQVKTPEALKSLLGLVLQQQHFQGTAADLAGAYLFTAEEDGELDDVVATAGAVCASGESMTIDILKNGATVLSSTTAFTETSGKSVTLAIDKDKKSFKKGDVFTVTRDYTAGGGPTPLVNTTVIARPTLAGV